MGGSGRWRGCSPERELEEEEDGVDGRPFGGLDPGNFLCFLPGCSTLFVCCLKFEGTGKGRGMGEAPRRR